MPENEVNTQAPKKEGEPKQQDGLALVIGGLFILALVFSAYNYFKGSKEDTTVTPDVTEQQLQDTNKGDLNGEGASDTKETNGVQVAKPENKQPIKETISTTTPSDETWVANDYNQGDIKAASYNVKRGDTLWEIAEGAYGDGSQWVKILESNRSSIGFLPNGQQSLIVTGQALIIP